MVADPALVAQAKPEQCVLCHTVTDSGADGQPGSVANTGPNHMAQYKKYADASKFTLTIDSVTNAAAGFCPDLHRQEKWRRTRYCRSGCRTGAENFLCRGVRQRDPQLYQRLLLYLEKYCRNYTDLGGGQFSVKKTGASFFPELQTGAGQGAQVYAYVADGLLDTEGAAMYDDVANAGMGFGDAVPASANSYQSAANVSACETCHGKPYMKHGYRMAHVTNGVNPGLTDFSACKDCHASDASGHGSMAGFLFEHDLNYLIANSADPTVVADATARLAQYDTDGVLTQAEKDKYSASGAAGGTYKMTLINDVHISHTTDFPYPQHMNSCVTCHKGKMGDAALNDVFADAKFKPSNCITCHGVEGLKGKMAAANYNHAGFISQMDDPATRDSVSCTELPRVR